MKKILVIILLLASLQGTSQPVKRDVLWATNSLITNVYFIWRQDTIDFSNIADIKFSPDTTYSNFHDNALISDRYMKVEKSSSGYMILPSYAHLDSLVDHFLSSQSSPYYLLDTLYIDDDGIIWLQRSETEFLKTTRSVHKISDQPYDSTAWQNIDSSATKGVLRTKFELDRKTYAIREIYDENDDSIVDNSFMLNGSSLSKTEYGDSWIDSDSVPTQGTIALKINSIKKSVFRITLPYSTSVAGRILLATEGTDYPTGWMLVGDGLNLVVTHNLGRWVTNVTVWANTTGTQRQQLFNTAAHNGVTCTDDDNVTIYSLATISKPIIIYLAFE